MQPIPGHSPIKGFSRQHRLGWKKALFILVLGIISGQLTARDAPITTAGSSAHCPGAAVTVPLTVTNFISVSAISLRLDYDPTMVSFVNHSNINPSLPGIMINDVGVSPTLRKVLIVWTSIIPLSLSNGSKLMDLNFTLTGGAPVVSFNNTAGGGGECEYADENGMAMNDLPTATFYHDAVITNLSTPVPGPINGPPGVCAGSANVVYGIAPVPNATTYNWSVPPGATIVAGAGSTTVTISFSNAATSGNIAVFGTGPCGSGPPSNLPVTVHPRPVPVINGNSAPCASSTGIAYTTEAGMTGYTWTVSAGGTITSGATTQAIMVTWNTPGAQSVSVTYITGNGCSPITPTIKNITVDPRPVPTITGQGNVCLGSSSVTYTTETGMLSYDWNVSAGGTITSGANTSAVQITWNTVGNQSVNVTYIDPATGCSALSPTVKSVVVNPLPAPTITGPSPVCQNAPGNIYSTEPGMSNYAWAVSAGGTITAGGGSSDNSVTVIWTGTGTQSVGINYVNGFGCAAPQATTANITVNPVPGNAGPVMGPAAVCQGSTGIQYAVDPIPYALTYLWNFPSGVTITAGSGTPNITVTFGPTAVSGNISVAGNNLCGNGTTSPSFGVSVDLQPGAAGAVSGPASVCAGQEGAIYSVDPVLNATGYQWTLPSEATITAGANSPEITVTFGLTPGSGVITAAGTNGCGSGTVSPDYPVVIHPAPAAPVVTAAGPVLTSSYTSGNQWYYEGNAIPGATYQIYTVTNNTGYYWCIVTLDECPSPPSNKTWIVVTGIATDEKPAVTVYPNPSSGLVNIGLGSSVTGPVDVNICDQTGVILKTYRYNVKPDDPDLQLRIDHFPPGVYILMIRDRNGIFVKKITRGIP
jgi:hypothetical protein